MGWEPVVAASVAAGRRAVGRIWAKIERHEPFVETVRNVGYRFTER